MRNEIVAASFPVSGPPPELTTAWWSALNLLTAQLGAFRDPTIMVSAQEHRGTCLSACTPAQLSQLRRAADTVAWSGWSVSHAAAQSGSVAVNKRFFFGQRDCSWVQSMIESNHPLGFQILTHQRKLPRHVQRLPRHRGCGVLPSPRNDCLTLIREPIACKHRLLHHIASNRAAHTLPKLQPRGPWTCLLYTSDAADEEDSVDLGWRRFIKKKNNSTFVIM
eukprot:TRINITY_DN4271_c0_g1_i3.p1 TRINITY_DN4271_c0_g1~~TRINITY_DN4271_c0_g1_i3.p1  ORF type:complete len:221 (+),score=1.16 TRINITY_DN4271_c0_g1_i3:77-739(+)